MARLHIGTFGEKLRPRKRARACRQARHAAKLWRYVAIKKMNVVTLLLIATNLIIPSGLSADNHEEEIEIVSRYSRITTRSRNDMNHIFIVCSSDGWNKISATYHALKEYDEADFDGHILIISFDDHIKQRLNKMVYSKIGEYYYLDYYPEQIMYKLRAPPAGEKHARVSIMKVKLDCSISHSHIKIRQMNRISPVSYK